VCKDTTETNLLSQFLIRTMVGELKRHMLRDPLRDEGSTDLRKQVNRSPHLDLVCTGRINQPLESGWTQSRTTGKSA
jgi:hypothetical protein